MITLPLLAALATATLLPAHRAPTANHDASRHRFSPPIGAPSLRLARTATGADGAWLELVPPVRDQPCSIYDPLRQRMVVAGGYDDNPAGVWALSLDAAPTWSFVLTTGRGSPPIAGGTWQPAVSLGAVAIYDPLRDRMLVEGIDYSVSGGVERAWALSLPSMTWSTLATSGTSPPGRTGHSAIYDPVGDGMVTYGGDPRSGSPTSDVWVLSLGGTPTWSHITPAGAAPIGRELHAAVYDTARARGDLRRSAGLHGVR